MTRYDLSGYTANITHRISPKVNARVHGMQIRRLGCFVLTSGLLLLSSSQVLASLFEPISDAQLVCEATDVIHGQVTDVQAAWDNEHTAIWTTATVRVHEAIRGNLPHDTVIKVKEVGGAVADYTIKAEGFPTFQKGQEVVMLLQPWDDGSSAYRVWGYGRGLFSVDRRGGRAATASRHDVLESGRPTMFTDQIPPTVLLDGLTHQLSALARKCDAGARQ